MSTWPRYPTLYEINTWVWLADLARKNGAAVDLNSVPSAEWDAIAAFGFDGVWLMGVWERSPAGIAIANRNANLLADFRRALPDFRPEDNVGSPYCIRRYVVDQRLGGSKGLAIARRNLPAVECAWCSTSCLTMSHPIIRGSPGIPSTSSRERRTIFARTQGRT